LFGRHSRSFYHPITPLNNPHPHPKTTSPRTSFSAGDIRRLLAIVPASPSLPSRYPPCASQPFYNALHTYLPFIQVYPLLERTYQPFTAHYHGLPDRTQSPPPALSGATNTATRVPASIRFALLDGPKATYIRLLQCPGECSEVRAQPRACNIEFSCSCPSHGKAQEQERRIDARCGGALHFVSKDCMERRRMGGRVGW
jgi:hypothetical protein